MGGWKPDTRNSSRGLARVLARDAVLPKPLRVKVPSWDEAANKQVMRRLDVWPIHETLNATVGGNGEEWASTDNDVSQHAFRSELTAWVEGAQTTLVG